MLHDLTIRRKKSQTFFNPIKVVRKPKGFPACNTHKYYKVTFKQLQFRKNDLLTNKHGVTRSQNKNSERNGCISETQHFQALTVYFSQVLAG